MLLTVVADHGVGDLAFAEVPRAGRGRCPRGQRRRAPGRTGSEIFARGRNAAELFDGLAVGAPVGVLTASSLDLPG